LVSRWAEWLDAPFGSTPDMFPSGLAKAPFLWKCLGDTYSMEFIGGFVGVSQNPVDRSLRPAIGWAVCDAMAP
jgi:hypothetical protein